MKRSLLDWIAKFKLKFYTKYIFRWIGDFLSWHKSHFISHSKNFMRNNCKLHYVDLFRLVHMMHLCLCIQLSVACFYSQIIAFPGCIFLKKSWQWKHQNIMWKLFKVKILDPFHSGSLLLTSNRFHTLLWCFHSWLEQVDAGLVLY